MKISIIKVLLYLIYQILLDIFCEGLPQEIIFTLSLGPDLLKFTISSNLSMSKVFLTVKPDIWSNGDKANGCICNFSKITILYFILKGKFGIKYQLNSGRVVFVKRWKTRILFEFSRILKEIRSRRKFSR